MANCKCGVELKTYWVWWERGTSSYLTSQERHSTKAEQILAATADDAILGIQGFRKPYLSHDVVRDVDTNQRVIVGMCDPKQKP